MDSGHEESHQPAELDDHQSQRLVAVVRYHLAGDVEWRHFPLFILNKATSLAAIIFVACSYLVGKVFRNVGGNNTPSGGYPPASGYGNRLWSVGNTGNGTADIYEGGSGFSLNFGAATGPLPSTPIS